MLLGTLAVLLNASWSAHAASDIRAIVEISRHGARGPGKIYPFNSKYWKENDLNELTGVGMRQHYLLGAEFRQRYIVQKQLLSPYYQPSEVDIHSTDSNRTLSSAYCQLLGLYPYGFGPQLSNFSVNLPMFIHNLTEIQKDLGLSALPNRWQIVPISSKPDEQYCILKGYSSSCCPRLDIYEQEVMSGNEYLSHENELKTTLFPQLSQALGLSIKTIKQAQKISSTLECDFAAGHGLPPNMTLDLYEKVQKVHAFYRFKVPFSHPEALKLSFSGFLSELMRLFSDLIKGKGPKFTFFSSHDTMLSGLLSLFQCSQSQVPPFASAFLFELLTNNTIKITFNDLLLPLPAPCLSNPCPWSALKTYMQGFVYEDYRERCRLDD